MGATALLGLFTTQAAHIAITFDSDTRLYTIIEKVDKSFYNESRENIMNTSSGVNAWREFNRAVRLNVADVDLT